MTSDGTDVRVRGEMTYRVGDGLTPIDAVRFRLTERLRDSAAGAMGRMGLVVETLRIHTVTSETSTSDQAP